MTEETVIAEEQSQPQVEAEVKEVAKAPEPSKSEAHWAEAREVLRQQKQRIEELEARVAAQKAPPPAQELDELDKLDPTDYLTVEQALKLVDKKAEKKAEIKARQVVAEFATQQKVQKDEDRMRSKYDDFDYVIENFALPMIKNDPSLAYSIQMSKNPAETAYKLAKLSDTYEETVSKKETSPKAEKVLKNASRPTSSQAVSSSLQSQANDFTKMSPSQVWEISQKYARGA